MAKAKHLQNEKEARLVAPELLPYADQLRGTGRSKRIEEAATAAGVVRQTIYDWMAHATRFGKLLEAEGSRGESARALLAYLKRVKDGTEAKEANFSEASQYRQKDWRNRLSSWMALFYEMKRPEETAASAITRATAVSALLPRTNNTTSGATQRFVDDSILWLQQGDGCVSLLMKPEWCPVSLTKLSEIDNPEQRVYVRDRPTQSGELWSGLAETLNAHFQKKDTFNGFTYDLWSISAKNGLPVFTFTSGRYYGQVNCGEALLWELALTASHVTKQHRQVSTVQEASLRFKNHLEPQTRLVRRLETKPFDFKARLVGVGINTITVFAYRNEAPMFLMHERGKHFKATGTSEPSSEAVNMWHVIPAGTWQPYDIDDRHHQFEFRFEANVLREFCEEVLGHEDLMKSKYFDTSPTILYADAYEGMAPQAADVQKQLAGTRKLFETNGVSHWYLGCGLDLLTLKLEFCTLLIVDGDRFREEVTKKPDRDNKEGRTHTFRFEPEELQRELAKPALLPAGAACLWFANEHYSEIIAAADKLLSAKARG